MRTTGLVTLLALIGCNPDTTITKRNDAPEATIESPESSLEVREGDLVRFSGTVVDPDDDAADLVATWMSNGVELCGAAPVDEEGVTVCEAALNLGDDVIVLEGRDPENAAGIASVELRINPTDAPSVQILSPDAEGPFYSDHDVAFEALVGDTEDAAEDLVVVWTDADGATLPLGDTPAADGTVTGTAPLAEGPHAVTVTVIDTSGKTSSATVAFSVGGPNVPPVCSITAPADGLSTAVGTLVDFTGVITDDDVSEDWLVTSWESDLDGVLATGNADVDGDTAVSTAALTAGMHTITLTGTDEVGATCTDTVTLDVSGPPSVVIDLPLDGEGFNEGDAISFNGTVSDDSTPSDALAISWESDLDGVLDVTPADASGFTSFSAGWLTTGTHTVTLSATDAAGLGTSDTVTFVVNSLPSDPTVEIIPSEPTGDDDLVATVVVDAVDAEGDPITYSYAWFVDGAPTAYTGSTLPASATSRGETWTVEVTPNDGYGDGAVGSASVVVSNSPPVLSGVTLSPDPAFEGDTLTCTAGSTSDSDGDAVSLSYAWEVGGVTVGATGDTLDSSYWAHGDSVTCTVTPTDGTDAGAPMSASITVSNAIPSLASVEIDPDPAGAADTLTCSTAGFTDGDGDADQSTFEWTVNGIVVGTGTTLSGAFQGGDTVVCTVTPYDGLDAGTALSDSVIIDNTPPVLADVTLTPADPTESDTLLCSPGLTTDADGTTSFSYTYSWTVDGVAIGATGNTLTGASFDKHQDITCTVTPNDGAADGAPVTSNVVTGANTPPVALTVSISPTAPTTDDTLTAAATSSDADADGVTYAYTWYVNGAVAGTGASLSGAAFDNGDVVYVEVVPNDGEADGLALASAPVTIANTAPVVTGVTLTPTTAYEATALTCAATGTDADGDAVTFTYAWRVNGAPIAATGATLTGSDFDKGDDVVCAATPTDGATSGTAMDSNTVAISNTAPTMSSVTLTPTTAYETDTLTCTAAGADVDGDAVSYPYAWYVNGSAVAATSTTLSGTWFDGGDAVYCRATPTDGTTAGTAMSSNTVTIANTAPVLSNVVLTPTTASESSTLTCTPTATDVDGDAITYAYAWYVNGSAVAAATAGCKSATTSPRRRWCTPARRTAWWKATPPCSGARSPTPTINPRNCWRPGSSTGRRSAPPRR